MSSFVGARLSLEDNGTLFGLLVFTGGDMVLERKGSAEFTSSSTQIMDFFLTCEQNPLRNAPFCRHAILKFAGHKEMTVSLVQ